VTGEPELLSRSIVCIPPPPLPLPLSLLLRMELRRRLALLDTVDAS
jgi:hypothetical protein